MPEYYSYVCGPQTTLQAKETTVAISEFMIMASHQPFSDQFWHLTNQINFDLTNLLYIINGEVYNFTIGKYNFQPLS